MLFIVKSISHIKAVELFTKSESNFQNKYFLKHILTYIKQSEGNIYINLIGSLENFQQTYI